MDRRALPGRPEKHKKKTPGLGDELSEPGDPDGFHYRGVLQEYGIDLLLDRIHLLGGSALATDENAGHDAAVSRRQESFRHQHKQPNRAGQTNDPDDHRNPTASEEPRKRSAVTAEHALFQSADPA